MTEINAEDDAIDTSKAKVITSKAKLISMNFNDDRGMDMEKNYSILIN